MIMLHSELWNDPFIISTHLKPRRPVSPRGTCWEAGTACTTGAWVEVDVRRGPLDAESDPPSELCILKPGGRGHSEPVEEAGGHTKSHKSREPQ